MDPGQSTEIATEYVMSYVAFLEQPIRIDSGMTVINVKPGGWVKGPKISGKFVPPTGGWEGGMASGGLWLEVRGLIQTDDNAFIYISYNGIIRLSKESSVRMGNGEVLTTQDLEYFITATTFRTSSEKYAWLTGIQAVSKCVEIKHGKQGEESYVKYDVFLVR